jgi:hypothetical protein
LTLTQDIPSREQLYKEPEALAANGKALRSFKLGLAQCEAFHRIREEVFTGATRLRSQ